MKKLHFIAVSIMVINSLPLLANEIPVCQSSLTKQMKRFEKTEFTIPRKLPNGNLKDYTLAMEILCPWQVEGDFNGDRQKDWVGIIHRNNQFELVIYLSSSPKYKLQVLHTYPFFPEQSYLKVIRNKNFNKNNSRSTKYHLNEVTLNESSRIYALKKGVMKVISQYQDITVNKANEANEDEDIDELDDLL